MRKVCDMCNGSGRLTSLDQLNRSTAPASVPCSMCGGQGYVDDMAYHIETVDRYELWIDQWKEIIKLQKRLNKIVQHAQDIIANDGNSNVARKMLRIASGQEDGDT